MSHDEVDPRQATAGEGRAPDEEHEGREERDERRRGAFSVPMLLPGALARIALGLLILGGMTTGTFFLVTGVALLRLTCTMGITNSLNSSSSVLITSLSPPLGG